MPLGIRQSGLFLDTFSDLGELSPDVDGIGLLLGDAFLAATGRAVRHKQFHEINEMWNDGHLSLSQSNCISPERPGRRLIEEVEFYFCLERAWRRVGEGRGQG
jgi:hypothetical protein